MTPLSDEDADTVPVAGNSFPVTREEFDTDPRVSWSRVSEKFVLEADDGTEYEWDEALKRWIPVLDESLAEQQRAAYAVAGVDESEPAVQINQKKRKVYTSNEPSEESTTSKKARKGKASNGDNPPPVRKNTAIYITNLPQDVDEEEIKTVFSKCGVISEEIDRGKPRIKLYRDDDGKPKGDCLVVYFRPESVDLAIQMLDDTDFRFGVSSSSSSSSGNGSTTVGGGGRIKVQPADFSYKAQQEAPVKKTMKEKRKVIAKTQKLNSKLADWDDDDPSIAPGAGSRWDKVVILKHMFTLKELDDDPTALIDLKEDIREECEKLGDVTNVVLFDKEEDGVVSVRFGNAESARECIRVMNGRFFGGQKVEAYLFDGSEKFKKTSTTKPDDADGDKAEEERLEKFGEWLEESGE